MTKVLAKQLIPRKFNVFSEHTLITGKSGSGKSNTAEFIVSQKIGKEKIIDLYDDGRGENMCYLLPEDDPELIKKMRNLSGFNLEPKAFDTEVIMFAGERLEVIKEKDLPKNIRIYSIHEKDITLDDIKYLLASTDAQRNTIDYLYQILGDVTLKELYDKLIINDPKDKEYIKGLGNTKWGILRHLGKWLNSP